ncbi:DUF5316 family protein [Virgibacillus doumboii]|uniref:DUF5316 family protein n=1 Tax=Virgibacillus doumboii TaxID=2697503 RepID=UPI0013DF31DA|nr:DUF5316 family protein [Virgibacillus doumboii]
MKKSFFYGTGVALLLLVVGFVSGNADLFGKVAVGIGVFFLIIAGLTSGAFVSGAQLHANYATETKQGRAGRQKAMFISGIVMVPHFLVGIVLLYLL